MSALFERIVLRIYRVLFGFQLGQRGFVGHVCLEVFEIFLGIIQRFLRVIDFLLVRHPLPLTGASVVLPDGALILRIGKLGLCLLDSEDFFFEVKLLVAGVLLLFECIDLRVDGIQFILPLVSRLA